jgi:hypothetical protein
MPLLLRTAFTLCLLSATFACAQSETLQVPADSPRWDLQGRAQVAEFQGRKCLLLDGGAAILKDFQKRDGVIDMDVATTAFRGFFGIDFRLNEDGSEGEELYLRPHKSRLPDAMQYTPILHGGRNWQIFSGPGFTGAVDIPKNEWFHLRVVITGAQAKLYLNDMEKPALVMDDLKSGQQSGQFALMSLIGANYFTDVTIRKTPDAPWQRHLPEMAKRTLVDWEISPAYDALSRNLEKPLTSAEMQSIKWQAVKAEAPGFVVLYRYLEAPHLRVTFADNFSKRLDPQPGMKLVYARTTIDSARDEVRKLQIGYSDDVSVFLNGQILFRGRSAQNFRDPGFLGIMDPEDDTVYLPLKKGKNELVLAVSELGGGWGFNCRLAEK